MRGNRASYNAVCAQWGAYRRAMPVDPPIAQFARELPARARVLDVGCGTGEPIARYLAGLGFAVTGIDIAQNMVRAARALALPRAVFRREAYFEHATPTPYDGIVAFDVFFHIPAHRQADIYAHAASLLKSGGRLLFTHGDKTGSVRGEMFGRPFWYSALDAQTVCGLLESAGFDLLAQAAPYACNGGTRDLLVRAVKR